MASQPVWRTATYTGGNGNCVEVADAAQVILVRDTKDRAGVTLYIPASAWERFTTSLRATRVRG
jgi:hypothetical protein